MFTSTAESPEVIWNPGFRAHLVEMVEQHVGDFPVRLRQHTTQSYDYLPIPNIHYPVLETELYVGYYYLRHLCDERRYPNWHVRDPLKLLREAVERWRLEMEKGVADTAVSEAAQLLGLTVRTANSIAGMQHAANNTETNQTAVQFTGRDLRKAYRKLARLYHPDRNPAGRDVFEKVQAAYELLSTVQQKRDATDMSQVLLLLRTQILIYRRYGNVVSDQKYPAYALLMSLGKTLRVIKMTATPNVIYIYMSFE